jgi:DNA repair protein RecN (Recombination protein N)
VKVKAAFDALALVNKQIEQLTTRRTDIERRADYLRHVVDEIERAKLTAGEDVKLEDEARRLENADELRTLSTALNDLLAGEEQGAIHQLDAARRTLAGILRVDPSAAQMQELLDTAYYALEELSRAADTYAGEVELDPERLVEVRARRDLLYGLLKKYGPTLDRVIETGATSHTELDTIDSAGFDLAALEERKRTAESTLAAEAGKLSDLRASAAKKLSKSVVPLLKELGMPDGKFGVALIPRDTIASDGAEAIEFRVALNVGHEERPLSRVASGGELSRVMLALKTILAKLDAVPTLIFDEVDAGIGGRVGLQVGDTLRRVARDHQVFAISHLPQIAARAHHHIVVAKGAKGGVTTADISILDGTDRVAEIARMLGGDPESKVSRAHAKELLESSAAK